MSGVFKRHTEVGGGDSIVVLGSGLPDYCDSGGDPGFWCDRGSRSNYCQGLVRSILNPAGGLADIRVARAALDMDSKMIGK